MPGQTGGPSAPGGRGGGIGGIFDISQMATSAGQAGMGHLISGLFANSQDRRQIRQQEKLMNLQIVGQKHMLDYDYAKQLQMWKDTNYSAQVEQLKQAGLNPGLLYGMSGGGGTTTGHGSGNVSGGQAAGMAGEGLRLATTMMELGLQRAQKENIEADTAQKKAETEKTAGVDTKLAETQAASLSQGIQNQKAAERLTNVETELRQIETKYSRDTLEERITIIEQQANIGAVILQREKLSLELDQEQFHDKINLLRNEVAGSLLRNALTEQQITASKEEIEKWQQEIAIAWANNDVAQRNTDLTAFANRVKAKYPGFGQVIGRILNEAAEGMGRLMGQKSDTEPPPRR